MLRIPYSCCGVFAASLTYDKFACNQYLKSYGIPGRARLFEVVSRVAEVNAGGSFGVTPGSSPLADVEGLGTRCTTNQLRAKINEVIAKLGGTVAALALAIAMVPCLGGVTVQTAPLGEIYTDSPVVTNVTLDVSDKADVTNTYTKAETDARIVELAPTPGDYSTVSNRAMSALQSHQSLAPATNYTDTALGAFASTGTVARASTYGTPTRWTDATGCVWEVVLIRGGTPVSDTPGATWTGYEYWSSIELGKAYMTLNGVGWEQYTTLDEGWDNFTFTEEATRSDYEEGTLTENVTFTRPLVPVTNLVGRVALTNDIPSTAGFATPQTVTNTVRSLSLGGIWDGEVWWTPVMLPNGCLTYQATTNVNMEANQ